MHKQKTCGLSLLLAGMMACTAAFPAFAGQSPTITIKTTVTGPGAASASEDSTGSATESGTDSVVLAGPGATGTVNPADLYTGPGASSTATSDVPSTSTTTVGTGPSASSASTQATTTTTTATPVPPGISGPAGQSTASTDTAATAGTGAAATAATAEVTTETAAASTDTDTATEAAAVSSDTSAETVGTETAAIGGGSELTEAQADELEAEQEEAAAEAAEDMAALSNPLSVPDRTPHLQTTVLDIGLGDWSGAYVNNQRIEGLSSGFSGLSTFLEEIHGDVLYRTYSQTNGWSDWAMNGQQTTHTITLVPAEAIQYRFAGPAGDQYDICYSTTLSDGTHTGWARNGQTAGTMGQGLYLTGCQLVFCKKGSYESSALSLSSGSALVSAHADGVQYIDNALRYVTGTGSNYTGWGWSGNDRYYFRDSYPVTGWQYIDGYKYYFAENGKLMTDVESLLDSDGPYLIRVNKEMNCMTIYANDGDNGYIIPVKSFLTSVGDDTPLGTFSTPEKYRWRLMIHDVYTQYATRLGAGLPFLIHSIIYDAANPFTVWASTYNNLGIARSSGCIRLASGDAKWVYDHCPLGTTVTVYNSENPGPFGRPTILYEIPFEQTWDPTDPNLTAEEIAAESARILAAFNQ